MLENAGIPLVDGLGTRQRCPRFLSRRVRRRAETASNFIDGMRAVVPFKWLRVISVVGLTTLTTLASSRLSNGQDGAAEPVVGAVRITGVADVQADAVSSLVFLKSGDVFTGEALEKSVEEILQYYVERGRFLARVTVEEIDQIDEDTEGGQPTYDSAPRLEVTLRVEAGPVVPLKRIDLVGGSRTAPTLVARVAGLQVGETLPEFNPVAIQRSLISAGLFEDVGEPELLVESDSGAVLRIPVVEGDPGSFDLVLGYLPPQDGTGEGSIIGNGHLQLRNMFGGGRTLAVRLNRLPGHASSIDARASTPFLIGLPLGASVDFHGLEQDSTYGKQDYGGEFRYYAASGMDVFGNFSREITSPGRAGLRLGLTGRQTIPDADAWFLGVGATVRRVDRASNPTRGMFFEMNLESGRKERSERVVVDADTSRRSTVLDQKRLRAAARVFLPTFQRQVLVFGADAGLLISAEYDRSDLFRFGGATTLRGYDEDRFIGRAVGRGLAEYRLLIDRVSYAYAFFDLGYVERPVLPDLDPESSFHPGYGIGIQFRTAVGLVNVSAAVNPESGPTDARIHAGLSFGL